MKLTDEQKELYSLMLPIYGAMLNQGQTAKLLNVSKVTLARMRDTASGISYIKKDGKSNKGTIFYPLQNVVKYLTENNVVTAFGGTR